MVPIGGACAGQTGRWHYLADTGKPLSYLLAGDSPEAAVFFARCHPGYRVVAETEVPSSSSAGLYVALDQYSFTLCVINALLFWNKPLLLTTLWPFMHCWGVLLLIDIAALISAFFPFRYAATQSVPQFTVLIFNL